MQVGNDLLSLTLFDGELLREKIEQELEGLAALPNKPAELQNLLHHVRRTLEYVSKVNRQASRYAAIESQALFDRLSLQLGRDAERHIQMLETRRYRLGGLAVLLLMLLGWTLAGLERERRAAYRAGRRLENAIESLSEGFALFDRAGRLILHNTRFLQQYPWLQDRLQNGFSYREFQSLQRGAGIETEPLVAEGETAEGQLERVPADDGRVAWYLATESLTDQGERVLVRVDVTEAKARELELAKLYRAVEQAPVSVMITNADAEIEYVNPHFERVSGYTLAEVRGRNPRFLKSGTTSEESYRVLWDHLKRGETWHGELVNRRKDGSLYREEAFISPVRDIQGRTTHYIALKDDVTERRRTEEALRLHAKVFEALSEGVMITDAQERILAVNPAFTRITGYVPAEVIGKTPRLLSSGHHDEAFYRALWAQLQREGYWQGEIEDRRKDGEVYPAAMSIVAVRGEDGQVAQYISVFSDISERKSAEQKIQYQANFDPLTGLPNRSLFLDRVTHAIEKGARESACVGLLFIDLDRFKEVNDTLGHLMGDRLLQAVAERLRGCVRESDTVSRFGGDEFVVLLEEVNHAEHAANVAQKILGALETPITLGDHEITVGASIGITHYPTDAEDAVTLLRNADMAMYRAKEAGRNNYQFFTPEINEAVHRRVALANDLRHAIEQDALAVVYQPIVSLGARRPVGFEALLRWQHPVEGPVSPEVFIPLAEETGLIGPIGEWVLAEAAGQVARWRAAGRDWRVGVNFSRRQMDLGMDVQRLLAIIEGQGARPADITLEITEGLMLDDSEETRQWLHQVRAAGIRLSVDDFGTGYSSLSYLKRYPVNTLKIDRSFVRDLAVDPGDAQLVEAIVMLARRLGLEVVAEGVETVEQLDFLAALGCEFAQGWWFGRPMPATEIPAWLARMADRLETG
ncbi:MAG: EAL domain-containing protein [Gammaproteobacteria bacterium]|nr:MAG: EAL domain-containing protein [Gammaproteobacteria bacterium]